MTLRRINVVDAIFQAAPTLARTRTAVTRIGIVKALTPAKYVTVTVGGQDVVANYLTTYAPVVADQVLLIVDGDLWVVLGPLRASKP